MAKKDKKQTEKQEAPWEEEEKVDDEEFAGEEDSAGDGPHFSARSFVDSVCEAGREVEESVMAFFPPEVTQHLVNSRKELVKAGMRAGEIAMERLDKKAQRAWDIHEERRARRDANQKGPDDDDPAASI